MPVKKLLTIENVLKQNIIIKLIFFCTLIFLTACNNQSKERKDAEIKKDTTSKSRDTTNRTSKHLAASPKIPFTLHTYILTASQLEDILKGDSKEIEFSYVPIGNNDYTLELIGSDGNDGDLGNSITLPVVPKTDIIFTKGIANNQRVTRGDIKTLYRLPCCSDTPIDAGNFKGLLVTPSPQLNDDNSVYFSLTTSQVKVNWKIKKNIAGQIYSKPSPPALACSTGCDDPSPMSAPGHATKDSSKNK